jgi:hypothetical protein
MRVEQPVDVKIARQLAAKGMQPRKLVLHGNCSAKTVSAMSALLSTGRLRQMLQHVDFVNIMGEKTLVLHTVRLVLVCIAHATGLLNVVLELPVTSVPVS